MSIQLKLTALTKRATELAQQNKFQEALELIDKHGEDSQGNAEAQYIRGVCLRCLNQNDNALSALQGVLDIDREYIRAHQELGHVYKSQGNISAAIDAYEAAVRADNALIVSWKSLLPLYQKQGITKFRTGISFC